MTLRRLPPLVWVALPMVMLSAALGAANNPPEPQTITLPAGFSFGRCAVVNCIVSWQHLFNDWGQVAGSLSTGNGSFHASVWSVSGGRPIDLGTLPAPYNGGSAATAVNDIGVVGYSWSSTSTADSHAFLWVGNIFTGRGSMTDLGTLPAPYNTGCLPVALNMWGQVVGNCGAHAFLWSRNFFTGQGEMKDLGTLPAPFNSGSVATAINDLGQVVGYAGTSPGMLSCCDLWGSLLPVTHAFLWRNGSMTDLGTLAGQGTSGAALSMAFDINNLGQVVGVATGNGPPPEAVVWQNGTPASLASVAGYSVAWAVNELGEVVGESFNIPTNRSVDAMLWQRGSEIDLGLSPVPGVSGVLVGGLFVQSYTSARAVNNRGQVLGVDLLGTPSGPGVVLWAPAS